MRIEWSGGVVAVVGLLAGGPAVAQDLQEKVAAVKQAAAANQQALRGYAWIEKTELSLKGEVKNTKLQSCRHGAGGKVEKTPLTEPEPAKEADAPRGPRGRARAEVKAKVVEKKKAEMQAELEAAAALVHQYLPPAPEKIQAAMAAGKLSIVPGGAGISVRIGDYARPGDSLVLTLDPASKGLKKIDVDTWLEDPKDPVALDVGMQSLPDGTDYAGEILLAIPGSKIEVRISNSNYMKLAP